MNLFVYSGYSQTIVPGSEAVLDKLRLNKSINGIPGIPYSSITGDPYLFKDFKPGQFVLKTGETVSLYLRYDIYADQIHIKDGINIFALILPERISLITIDSMKFIYSGILKPGESGELSGKSSYFILLADGNCKLLEKKNLRIQDAEPPKLYQEAKPARFIHTGESYYIMCGDKGALKIDSRKDLLQALKDKPDEISKFMKSRRLGTGNPADLVKIVNYYNGI